MTTRYNQRRQYYGVYGTSRPLLGNAAFSCARALFGRYFSAQGVVAADSPYANQQLADLSTRLKRGEKQFLVGLGISGHNSGCALVEVSNESGVRLLFNNEEERHVGVKHYPGFPELSLQELRRELAGLGIGLGDVHTWLAGWDYPTGLASTAAQFVEDFPQSLSSTPNPHLTPAHMLRAAKAPTALGSLMGLGKRVPIVGMLHHENHAYFSFAVSPFARCDEPVMISVMDGYGDDSAISLYEGRHGTVRLAKPKNGRVDSLGIVYGMISSTQGGWSPLSSEGRYMGAAAWGDGNRLTNPYYRQLRQLLHFGPDGALHLNRAFANWHRTGYKNPYTSRLEAILGRPIPLEEMWSPDAVLDVDSVPHAAVTTERVDKAAALQLVFEDGLFHVIDAMIRRTGSHRLVLSGGTALNCIANQRLLDHFDEAWYARHLKQHDTRLHVWVPPVPADNGVPPGAAFQFALRAGAPVGPGLEHAFYNGLPPSAAEIRAALDGIDEIAYVTLENASSPAGRLALADFVASVIVRDGIVGLFQGSAETGPRALGHRSILANPCNPKTLEIINDRVKFRERIRPLCPMVSEREASKWFELSTGASDHNFNAYNYMVLTARARDAARHKLPAVVHQDGSARIQIVREATDPFCHALLEAMGRRVGAEVVVNTSLNVGSPIVQRPDQALVALTRSKGMDGLLLIADDGTPFLAWHAIEADMKDGGRRLRHWLDEWRGGVSTLRPA